MRRKKKAQKRAAVDQQESPANNGQAKSGATHREPMAGEQDGNILPPVDPGASEPDGQSKATEQEAVRRSTADYRHRAALRPDECAEWSGLPERKIREAIVNTDVDHIDMGQKTKVIEPADFLDWLRRYKKTKPRAGTKPLPNPAGAPAEHVAKLLGSFGGHTRRKRTA